MQIKENLDIGRDDLPYWLALIRAPLIGAKTILKLVSQFSNIVELFNQKENFYQKIKCPPQTIAYLCYPDWQGVEQDLKWLSEGPEHSILTIKSPSYPKLLLEISDPPTLLFIKGKLDVLQTHQIAMVGSRKPSPSGKDSAFKIAQELGKLGITITSGLAVGIDTAAHQGALTSGKTVAVLGTGINICYPKSNLRLAEEICEQGALVSEFPINAPPLPEHFPRRNRIVSGLSLGTIIVEANLKSGSLITANFAANQGREVFAIPGSINNPLTRGCHFLIKQGAKLVESPQDILEEFKIFDQEAQNEQSLKRFVPKNTLDDIHLKLLECVGYEPAKIDILVERSNLPIQKVTSIIMNLELAGYICSTMGGYMRVS